MINNGQNGFVLQPGETVLWEQVLSEEDAPNLPPSASKIVSGLSFLPWMLLIAISFWNIYKAPPETVKRLVLIYFPLIMAVTALGWFWNKTRLGRKLDRETRRHIFQNGILTTKRLVLFNHAPNARYEFRADEISHAALDYENGGYALRVTSASSRKDSILVGIGDFQKAADLIQTRLLERPLRRA